MRKAVVVLVALVFALALAGCGGGAEEPAASAETPVVETPAAAEPVETEPDRSANDADLEPVPFPSFVNTGTPSAIADRLKAGRPMIIFFFDSSQTVTADVRAEVDAVMEQYRGLIDLVTYEVGGPSTDPATAAAAAYASELGAGGTPYLVVVDKGGYITWRWKGFTERGYLQLEVERATR